MTVTHAEVIRYFMTIPEAAQLVIQSGSLAKGGDVFVLDMGKPIKILDLAKKMIILSGKRPVMESTRIVGVGEIPISLTGLRPGEKMYEELSYSDNLIGTLHPRIMKTDDDSILGEDLDVLLKDLFNAISLDDYKALFKIVRKVCKSVPSDKTTSDVFFNGPSDTVSGTVVSLTK